MAIFKYKAISEAGKVVESELEAAGRGELMRRLKDMSLSPMEITEKSDEKQRSVSVLGSYFASGRVSKKSITQFTAQLSALINAKMNLSKALKAMEKQSANDAMRTLISSVFDDVQKGKNLSDALEAYPKYFSPLYVNMVKVGELGGVLDKTLQRIVDMRTKDDELLGKIRGALAYPCVMATVMLGSVIVMLTFVIPKFSGVFSQMGTNLPFTTKVVIYSSDFLKSWWWLIGILIVILSATGYQLLRKDEYRVEFDRLKLSMPVIGKIMQAICIARFSLSMGALLSSGVSMMKALEATIPITGNLFIERALTQISREVREGGALSDAMRKRDTVFPVLMTGMVGTGEEAGTLEEMLTNVGEYFRKESEEKINTLTTLFEPVMIVVMGGIVGFIISAILLPIFNMTTSIH